MNRSVTRPLLCELHAHTTWSDGALSVRELVDLYGTAGFDVLCVTDHVVDPDSGWLDETPSRRALTERHALAYFENLGREATRGRSRYDLLLVPGLELTYNHHDPQRAGHALAIGLETYISLDEGLEVALESAHAAGAAIIAAHPHENDPPARADGRPRPFTTQLFSRRVDEIEGLVHRFELFNQCEVYPWVSSAGLLAVAAGDFHTLEHLAGWKTLLPCAKKQAAVVDYLRSDGPAYLARFETQSTVASECEAA